jgi:uncharacterized protein YneF (UPF0154 family)
MDWILIISILGVIGTWIGIYLAYKTLKKDTNKIINSFNKSNLQRGNNNFNNQ